MNTATIMKIEYMINSHESRVLREFERTCKAKAKKAKARKSNYPTWEERRAGFYAVRMELRKDQRALHLARAFVKGRDYKSVEDTYREGNEPNVSEIVSVLKYYDYNYEPRHIEDWIAA